jgi:hypothetical protein
MYRGRGTPVQKPPEVHPSLDDVEAADDSEVDAEGSGATTTASDGNDDPAPHTGRAVVVRNTVRERCCLASRRHPLRMDYKKALLEGKAAGPRAPGPSVKTTTSAGTSGAPPARVGHRAPLPPGHGPPVHHGRGGDLLHRSNLKSTSQSEEEGWETVSRGARRGPQAVIPPEGGVLSGGGGHGTGEPGTASASVTVTVTAEMSPSPDRVAGPQHEHDSALGPRAPRPGGARPRRRHSTSSPAQCTACRGISFA